MQGGRPQQWLWTATWIILIASLAADTVPDGCPYIELGTQAVMENGSQHWIIPITCDTAGNHGNNTDSLWLRNPLGVKVTSLPGFADSTPTFLVDEMAVTGTYRCIQTGRESVTQCPRDKARVHVTRADVMWAISEARHEHEVLSLWNENRKLKTMLSQNCRDVQKYNTTSGVVTVYPGRTPVTVYCDQDTPPGGWTVIQRRQDGRENFDRNWTDYENGFGDAHDDFWLGLSNIRRLTSRNNYSLRVDLEHLNGTTGYALYDTFYIDGASDNYRLHVAGYSGTIGDRLKETDDVNGNENVHCTSTYPDYDLTRISCGPVAVQGRWLNHCFLATLNGQSGYRWFTLKYDTRPYRRAEMKIRPRQRSYGSRDFR